jgi:hypothetical protein
MKNVILSKNQLIAELSEFRKNVSATGTSFCSCVYFVDESGSKTVKGEKVLQKFVRVNITLGASYEKRVNRDLIKQEEEANFTAQKMSGKEYINNEGIIATDTKTQTKRYLVATIENHTKPQTVYFHERKHINKSDAIDKGLFMPSYFTEKTTSGRGNVQESTDFHTITLNIDNLISLKVGGKKYIVK